MIITAGETLWMRTLSADDAEEVYRVIDSNRDHLRAWLPWVDGTDSPTVSENVIALWQSAYESGSDIVLGIFRGGEYVGNIGLHDISRAKHSGMIGYWLAANHQGLGIMTDCVRALTGYAFDELSLNRVCIHCAIGNKKSRAIPERLGFVQEGVLQDGECLYGTFHDLVIYGMIRRNWRKPDFASSV